MPYKKTSEAPANIKKLDGVSLTLSQINFIARIADALEASGKVESPWGVAIAKFKKSFTVKDGKWTKKEDGKEKKEDNSLVVVEKEGDRYRIVTVSTVALPDREGETFTTQAMDFDIALAKETKQYPEYRLFHNKNLPFGKVTDMSRVGMFAIEEGYSYEDEFSKAVVKNMLLENDGTWRVSRGFNPFEVSGACPECGERLVVRKEHITYGYRCPECDSVFLDYKGILKDIRFKQARTFDITVTDIPCVPLTGAAAFPIYDLEENLMDKKELRKKLLEANLPEDVVDAKLKTLDDERLKELPEEFDLPVALKELELDDEFEIVEDEEEDPSEGKELKDGFTKSQLSQLRTIVKEVTIEVLEQAQLDIPEVSLDGTEIEIKELKEVSELKESFENMAETVGEIAEAVNTLLTEDEERLKELMTEMPKGARRRLVTAKVVRRKSGDLEEDKEDEPVGDNWFAHKELDNTVILDEEGKKVEGSMTDFITAAPTG